MNILIFTNAEKLSQACGNIQLIESLGIIRNNQEILSIENPIISFANNRFEAFNSNCQIHLVFDGILNLNQNINTVLNQDSLVLWHINNPVQTIKEAVQSITNNIKVSMHERGWHYELVINALVNAAIANKSAILEKIIGIDIELEAKLELLHKCLVPSDAPSLNEFNSDFQILSEYRLRYKNFKETKKKIKDGETLEEFTDNDVFDPQYIEAVKQLRIALLGS